MQPVKKTYLEKMGFTRGSAYVLGVLISGGGFVEKNHYDSTSAIQAQLAEQATSIALIQQEDTQQDKKLDQMDHDLRMLTRAIDRLPQSKDLSSVP
jgi:septal ring factor EnvC (AmiA/AmiB activator)